MSKINDLKKEFQDCLFRMKVIENKLNHCNDEELDELSLELIAEKTRFKRIKNELTELYQQQKEPVAG